MEVAKLRVHEGFHPRGDLVNLVPLVAATGQRFEGFAVQAFLNVSLPKSTFAPGF